MSFINLPLMVMTILSYLVVLCLYFYLTEWLFRSITWVKLFSKNLKIDNIMERIIGTFSILTIMFLFIYPYAITKNMSRSFSISDYLNIFYIVAICLGVIFSFPVLNYLKDVQFSNIFTNVQENIGIALYVLYNFSSIYLIACLGFLLTWICRYVLYITS